MKQRLLPRLLNSLLFVLLTIILSACVPEATVPSFDDLFGGSNPELAQERIIYISSETVTCGSANCLLTRNDEGESWQQLDNAIIGFEFEENTAYALRVREDTISGTTVLRLVDVVSENFVEPTVEPVVEVANAVTEEVSTTEIATEPEVSSETATETATETSETATGTPTVETNTAEESEQTPSTPTETTTEDEASNEQEVVETITERELLLYVDQTLGACRIDSDDLCLRVRENRSDNWSNLSGVIADFDYVPGNYYVLRVLERTFTIETSGTTKNTSAQDTQTVEYSLVDLVSQTPATQEKLVYIGPEILSCDETGTQRCYQFKESRVLDYEAKAMDIIGFTHQDGYAYALKLLASLDQNSQVREYELIEIVNQELLADGRFVEKVIYIGPELASCAYGPSSLCYVFRESIDEPFRILSSEITGFRHQEGFDYELKVRQKLSQPDLESSTQALELVEILNRTAIIEEVPETEEAASESIEEEQVAEEETVVEENTQVAEEEASQSSTEATSPPTISETIAGAAQAQLENTANVDIERRNVTITVAPPAQAPLAVPTPTDATSTTDPSSETIEEVANEVSETEIVEEETSEEALVITAEEVEEVTEIIQSSSSVPIAFFPDLEPTDEREKIVFIGSSYEECEHKGQSQLCYQSKNTVTDDWFLLPYGIAGFDYEEGFVYVVRIRESFYGDDPDTGLANYTLNLIEVMAETEDKSFTLAKEAERVKQQTAALEEAALIAQTFEEEAAVITEDKTEQNKAEAEAIAADTQAALKAQQEAEAKQTALEEQKAEEAAEAARKAEEAKIEEAKKAEEAEATKKAEEEAARKKAEEETEAVARAQAEAETTAQADATNETNSGAPSTKIIFIAEQLITCQPEGLAEQLCYSYKENPEDDWQLLYNEIANFEFFEGYIYELEVIENIAENLPTDLGRWFEAVDMKNAFRVAAGN